MSRIDIVLYAISGVMACVTFVLLGWALHDIINEQRRHAYQRGFNDALNHVGAYTRAADKTGMRQS